MAGAASAKARRRGTSCHVSGAERWPIWLWPSSQEKGMRNRARGPEGLDPIAPHAPWSGWGFYSKSYKLPGTLEPENEMIGILF